MRAVTAAALGPRQMLLFFQTTRRVGDTLYGFASRGASGTTVRTMY